VVFGRRHRRRSRAGAIGVVLAALSLWPVAAAAQAPRTLREVIAYARQHAPRVQARAAERDRVRSEARARGFWIPESPSVGGEWTQRGPRDQVRVRDRVLEAGLEADPLQVVFRARTAGAERDLGLAEVDAQTRSWTAAVAWQHHERLRRLWLRDRSRRQAEISGRLADVVQRRFEAGDASGLELDLARIEAAEGRQRVFAAERALAEMEATLAAAIGWPNGTTLPEPDSLELVPGFPDTVDLASRALVQRPDLVVARAAAELGVESARHANSRLLPAANVGVFSGEDDGEDIRGMRAGLSVPFLGPPLAERGARAAEKRRLEYEMQAATRDAEADVTATRAAAALSFEQVSLYQSAILPGIQSARQRYEEAYTVGQIDLTTMLLGEQRYRDAERSFAEVLGTYIDSLRDLEVATGLPALSHAELDEEEKP
jgi:hypothetical protein